MIVNEMDFSNSAMVCFYLAQTDAAALAAIALPDGSEVIPVNDLHVTVFPLGKIDEMEPEHTEGRALEALSRIAQQFPLIRASISGIGRFSKETDGMQPVYCSVEAEYLHQFRQMIYYWFEDWDISRPYGYTPHITIGYVPANQPVDLIPPSPRDLVFDAVALSWGDHKTIFRLQGEVLDEMTANVKTPKAKGGLLTNALETIAGALGFSLRKDNNEMDKEKQIAALVANARCKLSPETLAKLDEAELTTLSDQLAEQPALEQPGGELGDLSKQVAELKGLVEGLTGQIKTNSDQEKTDLIERLATNQTIFSKDELNGFELPMLRKLQQGLTPADYSGRGLPVANREDGGWVEYEINLNGGAK